MSILRTKQQNFLLPFILVTTCFALWGFANDITNPMVKAFSKIFRMSTTEGALVQVAFYGGYFCMAYPAAAFIRRFSYKAGIMLGLALYALGSLLFFPAKSIGEYYPFLIAYFILTCGLSFLETSCNPYILTMGPAETATRRLNLAQSFNPIGSLCGMIVAMNFIQNRLNPMPTEERSLLDDVQFATMRDSDLSILVAPYLAIGTFVLMMLILFAVCRLPRNGETGTKKFPFVESIRRCFSNKRYREGVIAQFFYVGVQIMCWTFIIQYGTRILLQEGNYTALERTIGSLLGIDTTGPMTERNAEVLSQGYNIIAMIGFCLSRFVCTLLMRSVNPGRLLKLFAIGGFIFTLGAICFESRIGIYSLVCVSFCMSLMFPTIYGIALEGMGDDAKFGAAGLIMAILGGSVLPPVQASIIDLETIAGMPSINLSFILPALCFIVVMIYGRRCSRE